MTLQLRTGERRADIVAAVDGLVGTVDGYPVALTGHRDQPATVDRWQAWPVWLNAVPFTRALAETFWQVIVTLPAADQASTVDAADNLVSTVADALAELGKLTAIRPARLLLTGSDEGVPILQFEITI